jgi:hypothetical protein
MMRNTGPSFARTALACWLLCCGSASVAQQAADVDVVYNEYQFIEEVPSFGLLDPASTLLSWLDVADPESNLVTLTIGLASAIGFEDARPASEPVAYLQLMFGIQILTPFTRVLIETLLIDDPVAYLDAVVGARLLNDRQRHLIEMMLSEARMFGPPGTLTRDPFAIFVLDVCNGLDVAPEDGYQAMLQLPIVCGVTVKDDPVVTDEDIGDLLADPDFGDTLRDRYRDPVSPIDTTGARLRQRLEIPPL